MGLPTIQVTLLKEVLLLKKPTVVFLLNGGMVDVPDVLLKVRACSHVCVWRSVKHMRWRRRRRCCCCSWCLWWSLLATVGTCPSVRVPLFVCL